MCGAVQISLPALPDTYGSCACDMCRRATGSMFRNIWVADADLRLTGNDTVRTFDSSAWAERGFCGECGSPLWYRMKEGDHRGLSLGLFDDTEHLIAGDLYYSDKPICKTLRQSPANPMTESETLAHFTRGDA